MNLHRHYPDAFSRLDSPVHRLPIVGKSAVAFLLLLSVVISPAGAWMVPLVASAILIVAIAFSRVPAGFLLKRVLLIEPFILIMALATLLQPEGFRVFLSIVIKSTLSVTTVLLFANTTRFSAFLAMLKRLRMPALAVTLLALMYRYVFILFDEMERIQRARRSRSFSLSRGQRWHLLSTVLGELFVRSTERAERIYAAMSARGWK